MEFLEKRIKEIEERTAERAITFANDYYAYSNHIDDAISEFADSNTSIYYNKIMEYISNNPDSVNNAIDEFGWEGCGGDIYKAGQMAEYLEIQNELFSEIDNIILLVALNKLKDFDNVTAEVVEKVEEIKFEGLDNNSNFDDITDFVNQLFEEDEE